MDEFEARLTRELHQLVDGEHPSPELRERIAHDLSSTPTARSRRWMPAAAAALLVIAGIGAIMTTRSDDGGVDVATDPDTAAVVVDDELGRDEIDEDVTDTTAATTTTVTTAVTDTTVAPPPDDEATPPPPVAPADPGSGPATTVPQCQNSTDPSCGPFHWSPEPTNQPATLTLSVPDRVVAGQPVDLRLDMADPDGPVTMNCYSVNMDRPGTSTGGCGAVERQPPCPERYGPWSPPAPNGGQASTTSSVTFHETGTYVVTVNVTRPDGCDNVDPYRSGATSTLTVEVVAE